MMPRIESKIVIEKANYLEYGANQNENLIKKIVILSIFCSTFGSYLGKRINFIPKLIMTFM